VRGQERPGAASTARPVDRHGEPGQGRTDALRDARAASPSGPVGQEPASAARSPPGARASPRPAWPRAAEPGQDRTDAYRAARAASLALCLASTALAACALVSSRDSIVTASIVA
jgi:hypothetical protein